MPGRLFAIGDIHGCIRQLRTIIEDKIRPDASDILVFLGDYIDRGPDSKAVADYLIDLSGKYQVRPLMGNHELLMINSFYTGDTSLWFLNGGAATLKSFEISHPREFDSKYLNFFTGLLWYYEYEQYLFVHAGFNDDAEDPFEERDSMVWVRTEEYSHPVLKDRIIIHGHTPITSEQCSRLVRQKKNVINIDTGCVYSSAGYGILTALELKTGTLYFVG
jgi:serine/threonine protein phosphatase 1